ncbi:hypothetical protein D9756_009232 [Leucocoprinus leucothites]|uniref:Uncharacterized protein n=1 Tax=Leucocoprinus leucothites TaxID=201217 RepID=A0A8H5CY53_9AGAR|nr:hypothetical protein D9756_009232 [Leucoagaricus leucothites]
MGPKGIIRDSKLYKTPPSGLASTIAVLGTSLQRLYRPQHSSKLSIKLFYLTYTMKFISVTSTFIALLILGVGSNAQSERPTCETMGGDCVKAGTCQGLVNTHWSCPGYGKQDCCVFVG